MVKMAKLAGVAHNIAHHSASGVSYLSPHLAQALRTSGKETTALELLVENPYPPEVVELQPLRLALKSLKERVQEILQKQGFTQSDIFSIVLHVTPAPWDQSGYYLYTKAVITAKNGRIYTSRWL